MMTYVLCLPYWAIGVLGFSWVSATLDKASIFLRIGSFSLKIVIITPPLTEAVNSQCLARDLACRGPELGMFSYTKFRSHPWAAGQLSIDKPGSNPSSPTSQPADFELVTSCFFRSLGFFICKWNNGNNYLLDLSGFKEGTYLKHLPSYTAHSSSLINSNSCSQP